MCEKAGYYAVKQWLRKRPWHLRRYANIVAIRPKKKKIPSTGRSLHTLRDGRCTHSGTVVRSICVCACIMRDLLSGRGMSALAASWELDEVMVCVRRRGYCAVKQWLQKQPWRLRRSAGLIANPQKKKITSSPRVYKSPRGAWPRPPDPLLSAWGGEGRFFFSLHPLYYLFSFCVL